jgi:adenylate cyclase
VQITVTPLRIAVFLGLALAVLRGRGCHYLDLLDLRAVDYRLKQRGAQPALADIVIVAVDDASVAELGRWPWSRAVIAQLIDTLTAADAAVIGFDVVQSEATATTGLARLQERPPGIDEGTWAAIRDALERATSDDAQLAAAVRRSQRTILGYYFDITRKDGDAATARISTYNLVKGTGQQVPHAPAIVANLPALAAAARELGYFNFFPDDDGYFRRVPLAIQYRGEMAIPLSLGMLRAYRPADQLSIAFDAAGTVRDVRVGDVAVPVGDDGQMLVNFRGAGKTFTFVGAADVLAGRVPRETFRDKLVLVGVTAVALADVRATAFDGQLPGVEIHATVMDNILRRAFIVQPRWLPLAEVGVIAVAVLTLGAALHVARGVYGALAAVALLAGYVAGSQWLFRTTGLALGLVYPLLAISVTYAAISVQHYVVEEGEKRKIRNAFGLYLPPALATLVSEHPEMLMLGGDKRELTVMFSDIRGFTSLAEGLEPEALVELLNEFLGAMTEVIFAHDGTLDKYIGDAIMAVWGAPISQSDHATRACRAALDMQARLRELAAQWHQRGLPPLGIGIGVNTGPMVVGNMGSARRLSYTVIGDNVNLASRLEGLNRMYGSGIIISESTWRAAADAVVARELDLVRVKGKRQPVRIFEIVAPASERDSWMPMIDRFAAGIAAYRARQWDAAMAAFAAVLAEHPDDGPALLYTERCRALRAEPPAGEWDGVTVMELK